MVYKESTRLSSYIVTNDEARWRKLLSDGVSDGQMGVQEDAGRRRE